MSDYAYDASAQELYLSAGTPRSRLNTIEGDIAGLNVAIATKSNKVDLTNISITGSTNNTGATIPSGTFFYKDGDLVQAKVDIADGAMLTLNTNYEVVTAGGLNKLNSDLTWKSLGSGTGETEVVLPNNYQEIRVSIRINRTSTDKPWMCNTFSKTIFENCDLTDNYLLIGGYGASTSNLGLGLLRYNKTRNSIRVGTANWGSTSYISNTDFFYEYR